MIHAQHGMCIGSVDISIQKTHFCSGLTQCHSHVHCQCALAYTTFARCDGNDILYLQSFPVFNSWDLRELRISVGSKQSSTPKAMTASRAEASICRFQRARRGRKDQVK